MLLTAMSVTALLSAALAPAPASAQPSEEPLTQEAAIQQAAVEQSEAATEGAETAAERTEEGEFIVRNPKVAEEYPSAARKIERLRSVIAMLVARKAAFMELPEHSLRRKIALPRTHARIVKERRHLRAVRVALREKKEAKRV